MRSSKVARKITLLTQTLSLAMVRTSGIGLMTIQKPVNHKWTKYWFPARPIKQLRPHRTILLLVSTFLQESTMQRNHGVVPVETSLAIGVVPLRTLDTSSAHNVIILTGL